MKYLKIHSAESLLLIFNHLFLVILFTHDNVNPLEFLQKNILMFRIRPF